MINFFKKKLPGSIIAFESPEGGGKGTQIPLIIEWLNSLGYEVISLIEPGGTNLGGKVRELLLNTEGLDLTANTEMFLFTALRGQLVETIIRPALKQGKIVLLDRSFWSTYAYQGYGRGCKFRHIRKVTNIAIGTTKPDVIIYLDIPVEIGLDIKETQKQLNRLDKEPLEFHEKVHQGYKKLAKKHRTKWIVIDATESPSAVFKNVKTQLKKRFKI